ncbi:hypothetical protein F889_01671 [Acinetobacter colistiniresistens]|uniref:Uncharacterized protein n=1 Tax=Acinetobacter colistiniresistens TaxID=280145 RepID=N9PLE0_9GAMM|nr:hypothetical protein F889_01671 [Acinetobacter colistiniresistens]
MKHTLWVLAGISLVAIIIFIVPQFFSLIYTGLIYAELSGDFPLGDSRQPTYKSLRPFDLVS